MPLRCFGPAPLFSRPPASRRRWTVVLAAVLIGGAGIGRAEVEVWRFDGRASLAGNAVMAVGEPAVAEVDGLKAVVFDGERDGFFITANPIAGAAAFTIEVMFSPAADGPIEQRFFHVQDGDGRRALLEIRTDGRGLWWLDGFMRTSADPADKGLALIDPQRVHPTGKWYWVALRYDGQRLASFVNGVKECEGEKAFSPLGNGKISVGVRQNLVSWYKGAIAEVRFHREALPAEALRQMSE